jgi:hypothetical protein
MFVTPVTAKKSAANDLNLYAWNETFRAATLRSGEAMSAAVAKALRSGNLWLTLGYFALILLLMKAYA